MAEHAEATAEHESGDVAVERHGHTMVASLNRPHRGNSIQGTLFKDLLGAFEAGDADPSVRAIVTTGKGKTYCVGADASILTGPTALATDGRIDLAELGYQEDVAGDWGMPPLTREQTRADTLGPARWVRRVLDIGKPLVAGINGGVAGAGFALAMLHDVRIASNKAKFATNFVALGVSPELGLSWILPRVVGMSVAFDLLTRTQPVTAEEALELGLVEKVVDPDDLLEATLERARSFEGLSPIALRMAKRLLLEGTESTLEVQLEREWNHQVRLFGLPETGASMASFIGKALPGR